MIKSLKKYEVQLTPFVATKHWTLNNIDNTNILLTEDDFAIALEFLDYGNGSGLPFVNSACDIALEQQDNDLAKLEEGLKVTGPFYPNTDPKNLDGTYKRPIYYQVKTLFYNTYLDPTKIWGIENIDFQESKTQRQLSDRFRLIDIPKNVFGDKITPLSVNMFDNTLDNNYLITDDGNGNLFAGTNLFSHQQELGEYGNDFKIGSSSFCDFYWANGNIIRGDTGSIRIAFFSGSLLNQLRSDSSPITIGFQFGSTENIVTTEFVHTTANFFTGSVLLNTFPLSASDTTSVSIAFNTGSTESTTFPVTMSFGSASTDILFFTGSTLLNTFVATMSFGSSSTTILFDTGSYLLVAFPVTMSFNQVTTSIAFSNGSLI